MLTESECDGASAYGDIVEELCGASNTFGQFDQLYAPDSNGVSNTPAFDPQAGNGAGGYKTTADQALAEEFFSRLYGPDAGSSAGPSPRPSMSARSSPPSWRSSTAASPAPTASGPPPKRSLTAAPILVGADLPEHLTFPPGIFAADKLPRVPGEAAPSGRTIFWDHFLRAVAEYDPALLPDDVREQLIERIASDKQRGAPRWWPRSGSWDVSPYQRRFARSSGS